MAKKLSNSTNSKKSKMITEKQLPAFRANRLLLLADRFIEVRFTFKILAWAEDHQYYVTRIVFSDSINKSKLDSVIDIASRCGKLRQDLWNKYGSLQAWGISTNKVRDEAKKVFPPKKYGIPYKIWEATAMDVIDDIHACQEAAKTFVVRTICRQVKDKEKRLELIKKLDDLEFLNNPWLHQLVRNQYKRGYTYVNNQIVLNPDKYTVERGKDGITWVNIATSVKGERIPLRFRAGKNTISGRIRLIIRDKRIELHFPRLTWKQPNTASSEGMGLDKGYTEVFFGSNNKTYGDGLGSILTKETDARHKKGKARNKLFALFKNTKKQAKAERIRLNNLGDNKQNKGLKSVQSHAKSIIGFACKEVLNDTSKPIVEDLTQQVKYKQQAKKINRRLSSWTKGVIADMLQNAAERRCSTIITVNAAYSSQVDCRNGTLLGHRNGDQFFTFDGVKMQADCNAASNIEARSTDKEIIRWMKSSEVQRILLNRTAAFLEPMGMTLEDAVKLGWLDGKHLKQNGSLKRGIG